MVSGLENLPLWVMVLLLAGAFAAGWVDAVVGGGGLIQLPVTLLVPGIAPVQALATNKMGAMFGTAASSATYYRRVKPDLYTAIPMAVVALIGSVAGAALAVFLPEAVFKPIIVLVLIAVAVFTAVRGEMGAATVLKHSGRKHYVLASGIGLVIGFYDGLIGPGTGSFLVIALVSVMGYAFLQASAKAKIVNLATNVGALVYFLLTGSLLWGIGLVMGAANLVGGYLGARTAVARGNRFIRYVFLAVVAVLIIKLSYDVVTEDFLHH